MEGHRYADDAEPRWYSGRGPQDPDVSGAHAVGSPYESGIHERPSGAFRLPDQRSAVSATPYSAVPDPATTGSHSRPADAENRYTVRGPEYPTIKPVSEPPPLERPEHLTPMTQPTSLVPPVSAPSRTPESVYQTRRPISSVVVAVVMVVLMVPVVRLLIDATFSGDPSARAIVPAVLLTLGFALTGIGLFTVARGGPVTRDSWLRPPVAYLPAGLILLLAAGLAVA